MDFEPFISFVPEGLSKIAQAFKPGNHVGTGVRVPKGRLTDYASAEKCNREVDHIRQGLAQCRDRAEKPQRREERREEIQIRT
jgi:hypothetical protein